ncbi:prephenate/arogenate dehydrogenase [Chroococcidiopsis sp. CCMEE 29]|uniref:prephenate/arogenate dehydrogenase n=1 Tax=Chroococcidiopsis sp. CCMEE 29 TaxID=155894 RepID=UPI00201FC245|nr:prephenate/arogenate dehydrogenase [Chroococcidiopsis sp. CCMEE 29]
MNIGIVGLGLIGGCLGLDLRAQGYKVFGVSRRESTCQQAIALGVADQASVDLAILAATEVIFLCTPLAAILPTVEQLIPYLSPNTVLTDVGSVKAPVVEAIAPLWSNFVGGHPMAGKTDSGIEAAQLNLFALKPYVLTPIATTPAAAVEVVEKIARSLQATIYHCRPEEHDRAVSWISHLPVMVSAALIAACMSETNPDVLVLAQQLASSGFRDTSRVGGGNPELGMMMARYNRQELLRSLQHYQHHLEVLIDLVEQENWIALKQQLESNHLVRSYFIDE